MKKKNGRSPDATKQFNNVQISVWVNRGRHKNRPTIMFAINSSYTDEKGKVRMVSYFKEEDLDDVHEALKWVSEYRFYHIL